MTSPSGVATPPASAGLKRNISGLFLFLFILGDVLGAGIYALVGVMAGETGGAIWVPLGIALVLALLTAGSYAELVTKYPRAGGSAVFAERAFRTPLVSFLVGFSMLSAGVVSAAALALAFAGDYLSVFIQIPPVLGAILFLVLVALVNLRGIKESMQANFVMTAIELTGLLIVLICVAVFVGGGNGDPGRLTEFNPNTTPFLAVMAGALLAYYSYVGFETSANIVEEIRDPARVYPRTLFAALITAGVLYMLVAAASTITLAPEELADSTGPLLAVVEETGVAMPSWLFSAIALIAVANGCLLTMIMASRLTYGMAKQHLLPAPLGRVLPRRGTPWVSIIVTTIVAMALTFTGDLSTLANTVVLLLLFVFLSTNVAVLVLRRDKVEHKHFTVWRVIPVLAVLSCIGLMTQQSGEVWLRSLILLGVGVVLYFATRWWTKRETPDAADATTAR
ncbi:APC family permease [Salinibacterium sp. SYSU T00001]|uniref:APC family permease n=1 Tax=Homoserinimonas sedimenticola TaxID=2986805 RepID=UPI002235B2E0|nr:APC family permease [Salinibacterium sedimenticola]MCW4386350.1 APC family permease [Salinibacterium sedimenticola]